MKKREKESNWKSELKKYLISLRSPSNPPYLSEIEAIGYFFKFMNREKQLDDLYKYLKDRYNGYPTSINSQTGKPNYKLACCFSAMGMGKTTLFTRGIEKILERYKDQKDEFYKNLEQCWKSKQLITINCHMSSLLFGSYNEYYLCNQIFTSLFKNQNVEVPNIEFPSNIQLKELFLSLKEVSGSSLFIIHFDEVQQIFPSPPIEKDGRMKKMGRSINC